MLVSLIHQSDFTEAVLESELPVIIDVFANMCMPCQILELVLEELAVQYAGKVKFVKLNISSGANAQIATTYQIEDVPTLLLVHHGKPVAKKSMFGIFEYDEQGEIKTTSSKTELATITSKAATLFIDQYI